MKIVKLFAENFKRLRAVEITPDGAVVQITGKNSAGKSSVLDSITAALAGGDALPSRAIRRGEERAVIRLDLGELVVTRRFTQKGTTVTVEQGEGARFPSPQAMLDRLLDRISFDPLAFMQQPPAAQHETIRKLVGLDLAGFDAARKRSYEERTEVNREAKNLRARAGGIYVPEGTPAEPIDTNALLEEVQHASEHNQLLEQRKAKRAKLAQEIGYAASQATARGQDIAELQERIKKLEIERDTYMEAARAGNEQLNNAEPLPQPLDITAIHARLRVAQSTNEEVKRLTMRAALNADADAKEAEAAALSTMIEEIDAARTKAIAEAPMPVEGLSFGADELLYQGVPLSQASSAEQLRVSAALAMSGNPQLKVLRIKQGNDLDEASMKLLAEMVEARGFQCWIETIRPNGQIGIEIEDGSVVGKPAEEEPEPDTSDIPEQGADFFDNARLVQPGEGPR